MRNRSKDTNTPKYLRNTISIILIVATLSMPIQEVYAFNLFRELRNGIRKTAHFVVSVPDKATRWMGPVLGPAASFLLTKNLLKNPKFSKIFKTAQRTNKAIQSIEDINKSIGELKKAYQDEATKLRSRANDLTKVRKDFAKDLLSGDITFDEYKQNVANIQKIIEAHEQAAAQLDLTASNLNKDKFIKIFGNKFIKNTLSEIRDAVLEDISGDLLRTTDVNLIKTFVDSDGSFDRVLDYLVERELSGHDTKDLDIDDLKDRIRESIKDKLEENKDYLKDNWEAEIQALIQENMNTMLGETKDVKDMGDKIEKNIKDSEKEEEKKPNEEQQEVIDEFDNMLNDLEGNYDEGDFADCKSGYIFKPRTGKGCVQINCNEADESSHYSYTGDCICGSAGSINENPDDPNKGCYFPLSYESCPGCLYACVHSGEDCPLDGLVY